MEQINSEILCQFEVKGFSINEGVAVNVRLVVSANRPMSNDERKKKRAHRDTDEGQKDKIGKLRKRPFQGFLRFHQFRAILLIYLLP